MMQKGPRKRPFLHPHAPARSAAASIWCNRCLCLAEKYLLRVGGAAVVPDRRRQYVRFLFAAPIEAALADALQPRGLRAGAFVAGRILLVETQ
jgi:hypothetical protein